MLLATIMVYINAWNFYLQCFYFKKESRRKPQSLKSRLNMMHLCDTRVNIKKSAHFMKLTHFSIMIVTHGYLLSTLQNCEFKFKYLQFTIHLDWYVRCYFLYIFPTARESLSSDSQSQRFMFELMDQSQPSLSRNPRPPLLPPTNQRVALIFSQLFELAVSVVSDTVSRLRWKSVKKVEAANFLSDWFGS